MVKKEIKKKESWIANGNRFGARYKAAIKKKNTAYVTSYFPFNVIYSYQPRRSFRTVISNCFFERKSRIESSLKYRCRKEEVKEEEER